MTELYSRKWTKNNGTLASPLWLEALSTLSNDQIKLGVDKCKQRLFEGNHWAPDLSEFLSMIHGTSDVDYQAAFHRCLSKSPKGRVETWVYENAGYNIRISSHDSAERMHKKYMKQAMDLDRRGELTLNEEMLKALPANSITNLNDKARNEYRDSGKKLTGGIAERMERIQELRGKA